jgi:hypothetical protein
MKNIYFTIAGILVIVIVRHFELSGIQRTLIYFGIASIILPIAFILDRRDQANRPIEELLSWVNSDDHTRMLAGLIFLKKRKVDIGPYRFLVLKMLSDPSGIRRVAAKMAIEKCYPEDGEQLDGFEGTSPLEKSKPIINSLYQKYGLPPI